MMRLPLRLFARNTVDFIGPNVSDATRRHDHSGRNAFITVMNVLNVKKTLTTPEWSRLKNIFESPGFSFNAISVIMKKGCGLSEARKLKSALEENSSLNPITKAQMLRAYGFFAKECTETDHKFIEDTIDEVLSKFPVLTADLSAGLLVALISTPSWKQQADLILQKTGSELNHRLLSLYALLAFEHNEYDLGWESMRKNVNTGTNFLPSLYQCIIEKHESYPKENLIYKLIDFLDGKSFMMTSRAAEHLSNILDSTDKFVSRFATVGLSGHCSCCNRRLQKVSLTEEEYQKLLSDIHERFDLKCKFSSYEEEEVSHFKEFLEQCPQFSIVVDGLNMFYRVSNRTETNSYQIIKKLLYKLEQQGHKILVIARSHLRGNKFFCQAFKGHMIYFLNDRTKDDTFTIYSALSKGQDTLVLSNDFFGTYHDSVKGENKLLFRKWQLSNQMIGTGYLSLNFVAPKFSPVGQKSEDGSSIHIPLVTDDQYKSYAPYAWLCIQQVSMEEKRRAWRKWPKTTFLHEIESKPGVESFRLHAHNVKNSFKRHQDHKRSNVRYN
ncbi:mitochondrial ribonuclease P catalytic subunit isoform X2 [Frankliniella occidentalis]|uniref:Mitochondrial ribonuclease P catalytic subunit isoform X2 n=1 Tax=Frankliniella occidentalis TaxID=133901 RepID=A0A6J1TPE5_FRAOC|nr:mitochondrial ribonuclease P catalytic subunit isoform X2 [Frankliniella occidentalis]